MKLTDRKRIMNGAQVDIRPTNKMKDGLPTHFWGAIASAAVQGINSGIAEIGRANNMSSELQQNRQAETQTMTGPGGVQYQQAQEYNYDLEAKKDGLNTGLQFLTNPIGGIFSLATRGARLRKMRQERNIREGMNDFNKTTAETLAFRNQLLIDNMGQPQAQSQMIYAKNGYLPKYKFGFADAGKLFAGYLAGGVGGLGGAIAELAPGWKKQKLEPEQKLAMDFPDTQQQPQFTAPEQQLAERVPGLDPKDMPQLAGGFLPTNSTPGIKKTNQHVWTSDGENTNLQNAWVDNGESIVNNIDGAQEPADVHGRVVEGTHSGTDSEAGNLKPDDQIFNPALRNIAAYYTKLIEAVDNNVAKVGKSTQALRGSTGEKTDKVIREQMNKFKAAPVEALKKLSALNHMMIGGAQEQPLYMEHAKCGRLPKYVDGLPQGAIPYKSGYILDGQYYDTMNPESNGTLGTQSSPYIAQAVQKQQSPKKNAPDEPENSLEIKDASFNLSPYAWMAFAGNLGASASQLLRASFDRTPYIKNTYAANPYAGQIADLYQKMYFNPSSDIDQINRSARYAKSARPGGMNRQQLANSAINAELMKNQMRSDVNMKYMNANNDVLGKQAGMLYTMGESDRNNMINEYWKMYQANMANQAAKNNLISKSISDMGSVAPQTFFKNLSTIGLGDRAYGNYAAETPKDYEQYRKLFGA